MEFANYFFSLFVIESWGKTAVVFAVSGCQKTHTAVKRCITVTSCSENSLVRTWSNLNAKNKIKKYLSKHSPITWRAEIRSQITSVVTPGSPVTRWHSRLWPLWSCSWFSLSRGTLQELLRFPSSLGCGNCTVQWVIFMLTNLAPITFTLWHFSKEPRKIFPKASLMMFFIFVQNKNFLRCFIGKLRQFPLVTERAGPQAVAVGANRSVGLVCSAITKFKSLLEHYSRKGLSLFFI